jgi:hypothetical protein
LTGGCDLTGGCKFFNPSIIYFLYLNSSNFSFDKLLL